MFIAFQRAISVLSFRSLAGCKPVMSCVQSLLVTAMVGSTEITKMTTAAQSTSATATTTIGVISTTMLSPTTQLSKF